MGRPLLEGGDHNKSNLTFQEGIFSNRFRQIVLEVPTWPLVQNFPESINYLLVVPCDLISEV